MNLIIFILFQIIFSQNNTDKYIKDYSYSYLSTQFLEHYSKNIAVLKGKKSNITKCFANQNIYKNDIIFEYNDDEVISCQNIDIQNKEDMALIIQKYVDNVYLRDKLLLSCLIYYIIKNPYNIPYINRKLRLFILNLPYEEIFPIEFLIDEKYIEENLINKDWLQFDIKSEKEFVDKIINETLEINNNKSNEDYILFVKIYYYIKTHSFNIKGNAIIFPFMDTCNIIPYYLKKESINYDSIYIEEKNNKIFIKAKNDILQSDQFVFSFNIPLNNNYLLLKQGKSIYNNMNDKIVIKKKFESNNQINNFLNNFSNIYVEAPKTEFDYESKEVIIYFDLFPDKINELFYSFGQLYFKNSNNMNLNNKSTLTFLLRMCYNELNSIYKILNNKYNISFNDYLLKIQEEKGINEINDAINNFNLAKIWIIEKNINLAYKKLLFLNYKELEDIKANYI